MLKILSNHSCLCRCSKDSVCRQATDSSPNATENTTQCLYEDVSLAIDASGDVKTVARDALKFELNGKKLETYDIYRKGSTLSFYDSLLEKFDELNLRSQSEDTIVGGYKLCSDCLLKRKINCIDTVGDSLNVVMGASQSNNISPANDLWEVWELNNNKNDCKKEWNSPNRTSIGRRQSVNTLSFRSRSLPDLGIAECNSIAEGGIAESLGCILPDLDRPHNREEDVLRRQSLPDSSSFPSWPKESHSREEVYSRQDFQSSKKSVASGESRGFELQENYGSDKEKNHIHIDEPYVSLSSYRASSILDSDLVIYSQSPLISPVHNKPDLPYLFCENIYHIRSDSDLQGKYLKNYRMRAADDTVLSRSTSYLSQCILDEVVDYFPCKDDSHLSMTPMHQCYDWSLCIEPPCEHDRNNLTVSMKSKDEDHGDEPAYSYICSENEDLEGSFICSDCGTTVPHISVNKNGDHSFEGSMDAEKGSKANDEFVLICVPGKNEGNSEEIGSSCGSLAVYHLDDSARSRRLSGVHGSLENIEETDIEKDYEEFEQLGNDGCKTNGEANAEDKKFELKNDLEDYAVKGHSSDAVNTRHCTQEDEKSINQEVSELDKGSKINNISEHKDVKACKSGAHAVKNGSSKKDLDGISVKIEESKADCKQKKGKSEHGLESRSEQIAKDPGEEGRTFAHKINSDCSSKGLPKCVRSLDFEVLTARDNGNATNNELDKLCKEGKVGHGLKQDEAGEADTAIGNGVPSDDDKILLESRDCLLGGEFNRPTNAVLFPLKQNIRESSGGPLENENENGEVAELRILDPNTFDNAKGKSNSVEPKNLTGRQKQNSTSRENIALFEKSTTGGKDELEGREQMGREGKEDEVSLAIDGKETEEQFLSPLPLLDGNDCLHFAAIFCEVPEKNVFNYDIGGLKAALHTDIGKNDPTKRALQSGIETSALGLKKGVQRVPFEEENGIAENGAKKNEARSAAAINRRSSKCKHNFSISEYENLEPETQGRSCKCRGTSYGCLQCSCERSMSQSTSESLLSADTGIDVDDTGLTDWETFNQCLDFGSLTRDHCNCDRRKRMSSTPVGRRASVACVRGDVTGKASFQGKKIVKSQSETFDLGNLHLRTSRRIEAEPREVNGNLDHDFVVASSSSAPETNKATYQEESPRISDYTNTTTQLCYNKESALIKLSATDNEKNGTMVSNDLNEGRMTISTNQGQAAIDESCQRKLKVAKHERDTMALLQRMAKKAKCRSLKESRSYKIELFASKDNNDLHLRLFVLNFEDEEACHSSSSKSDCQKLDLVNAKIANLNSAMEFTISNKELEDSSCVAINCFNYCGNGKRVSIRDCWFMKIPKILAAILITIAERSEQLWLKATLVSLVLSNVCKYKTCPFSAIINWLLIQLKFIKSEFCVTTTPNARATLMLLSSLIGEPYFELSYLRQLAYVIARPRVLTQDEEVARKEFLCACLRIEIRSFAFSCKYAFKIFVSVQMLLASLEDELQTAFKALDRHLIEYMHDENCLDFVSDILVYLGLMKSEFPVNVTSDFKTCIQLLSHVASQEYFPLSGVMVMDAFLKKPNKLLKSAEPQKAELELVLQKRIKEGLNKSTEMT